MKDIVLRLLLTASTLLPATAKAALSFQQVILDKSYIAYERDVGDIDGDRRNDVVAVTEGDTTVQVFRAPTWARSTLITFRGAHRYPRADDFKLADIDRDGDLDVVTRLGQRPSDDGPGIAVWCENMGRGTNFTQHLIGNSLEYVKDIVVADFDRDRRPDVAMRMDRRIQLWLQNPGQTWSEVLLAHPPHEGMEAGDLDMDGNPDLILNGYWFETPDTPTAARLATNYVYHVIDTAWFKQTGDWTANSCKVVVGDFDGDRRNDVAFSHSERVGYAVAWYRSATPRADSTWRKQPVATVDYCHTLQAADFDLDGRVDLLVGGMIQSQHRGLKLMRNAGGGTNWAELGIQTNGSYSAELGDLDNDGDVDIVGIRNWNAAPTWIYRNAYAAGGKPGPRTGATPGLRLRDHNPILTEHLEPISFVDRAYRLTTGDPGYIASRRAMGQTRRLAERMNLAAMTPREDLPSSGSCRADPGTEYVVYLPSGGEVSVNLTGAVGEFEVEWIHPIEGTPVPASSASGGATRRFKASIDGSAVLHLKNQKSTQ